MNKHDQELLEKQLWGVSQIPAERHNCTDNRRGVFSRHGYRRYCV